MTQTVYDILFRRFSSEIRPFLGSFGIRMWTKKMGRGRLARSKIGVKLSKSVR